MFVARVAKSHDPSPDDFPLIGLTINDLTELMRGATLKVELDKLGMTGTVMIVHGRTDESIMADLKSRGAELVPVSAEGEPSETTPAADAEVLNGHARKPK